MARPLRMELAGGLYHVTSRGDRREDIYRDDDDRAFWLEVLGEVCGRYNWRVHAYCEMTNHYHFVVETPEANLSQGMRQLNGVYTQGFNRRHGLVGHLFQGRFKGILVERDSYLLEVSRYVVLNPVRARMTEDPSEWRWSSYGAMVGLVRRQDWLETDWLLRQFGSRRRQAVERYKAFVAEGLGRGIWEDLRYQAFLGSQKFVEEHTSAGTRSGELREIPRVQRRAFAGTLAHYEDSYVERREAMARAFLSGAYTMQEIAEHFGVHYSTVSRAVRRFETGN
ncbi:MAG: transposase [Gammaproteobacteria bacterium]